MTVRNNVEERDSGPWYREPWPWIIMAFPFASVLLGILMLTLALTTNNSLVVDDYYKQGKGINQRIARDRIASEMGVHATVSREDGGIGLTIEVPETSDTEVRTAAYSAQFVLRWTHVTQSERDGEALLTPVGRGQYFSVGSVSLPDDGRYRLHLEPVGNAWRLVSPVYRLESIEPFELAPATQAVPGVAS